MPNARTDKKLKKNPLWSLAKQSKFKKGHPLVVVPLDYEGDDAGLVGVFDGTDHPAAPETWERSHTLIRKLIVFKNKKNGNQAVIMYVISTAQYKKANPKRAKGENFTGILIFKDYDEDTLLEAWRMENGQVTGVRSDQGKGKSKKMDAWRQTAGRYPMAIWIAPKEGYDNGPGKVTTQNRLSAVMEDCNFVQTGSQLICDDGSVGGGVGDGGYFGDQLPSGGGGGRCSACNRKCLR